MSKDTYAYDVKALGMPQLRDIADASQDAVDLPSSLYVADGNGKPKFWVKVEPRVYLVGHTQLEWGDNEQPGMQAFFENEGLAIPDPETLHHAKDAGFIVETAGRLCYYSFRKPRPGGHEAYMNRIIQEGHGSVLEHAHFNFIITGVSRTLSHELVRHRLASYSQLSQRYFNETECAFICPPKTVRNRELFKLWIDAMETSYDTYIALVREMENEAYYFSGIPDATTRHKAILGEARSVLPNATETKLMFSVNGRALRGVLDQRSAKGADQEIRRMAVKLYELAQNEFPSLLTDYQRNELPGYGRFVETEHKKV